MDLCLYVVLMLLIILVSVKCKLKASFNDSVLYSALYDVHFLRTVYKCFAACEC